MYRGGMGNGDHIGLGDGDSDSKKLYFPDGALLNQLEISVTESEQRKSDIIKEPYIVYLVDSHPVENSVEPSSSLWRRYSEFELLRNYLMAVYPYIVMPPLPEKRINVVKFQLATDKVPAANTGPDPERRFHKKVFDSSFSNFDPDFIERRRQGLECFLLRLASHPISSQDCVFRGFLNQDEGWRESVQTTKYQERVDNRFKTLSAQLALKKGDSRFEAMQSYANALVTNITTLLNVKKRMTTKMNSIFAGHQKYGAVFSEWSGIEKEMADQLQAAGGQIDRFASEASVIYSDEEAAYVDQLREYLYFCEALKTVVIKYQLRQFDLERAEEALKKAEKQREDLQADIEKQALAEDSQLANGGAAEKPQFNLQTIQNAIFGEQTAEQKQEKLAQVDEQIKTLIEDKTKKEFEVSSYTEKAMKDYDRFKKQKVRDFKEITENYMKCHLKINKQGLNVWQATKDALKQ